MVMADDLGEIAQCFSSAVHNARATGHYIIRQPQLTGRHRGGAHGIRLLEHEHLTACATSSQRCTHRAATAADDQAVCDDIPTHFVCSHVISVAHRARDPFPRVESGWFGRHPTPASSLIWTIADV